MDIFNHFLINSFKDFQSQCTETGSIPEGLKFELEPTNGNQKQQFLDNCYTKLKDFFITLMKDIVKFCDDAIQEIDALINSTEVSLKQSMEKEEFRNIGKSLAKMKILQSKI